MSSLVALERNRDGVLYDVHLWKVGEGEALRTMDMGRGSKIFNFERKSPLVALCRWWSKMYTSAVDESQNLPIPRHARQWRLRTFFITQACLYRSLQRSAGDCVHKLSNLCYHI